MIQINFTESQSDRADNVLWKELEFYYIAGIWIRAKFIPVEFLTLIGRVYYREKRRNGVLQSIEIIDLYRSGKVEVTVRIVTWAPHDLYF